MLRMINRPNCNLTDYYIAESMHIYEGKSEDDEINVPSNLLK